MDINGPPLIERVSAAALTSALHGFNQWAAEQLVAADSPHNVAFIENCLRRISIDTPGDLTSLTRR
jgi:hypothetical protein